jgi:hypothetical protein
MNHNDLEWSDDLRRGERPEIRAAISRLRAAVLPHTQCVRCRNRTATHLIDSGKRAVCGVCADDWRSLTPMQRMQARTDLARRG